MQIPSDIEPVVIRGSARRAVAGLVLGGLILLAGILMIQDHDGSPVGYGFFNQFRPTTMGWLVLGLGLITATAAALSLSRGCPTLELDEKGITYKRCLQGRLHIGWAELDRVDVERTSVPGSAGNDINLEGVVLVTTAGRRIGIGAIAPVKDLEAAITSRAAHYYRIAKRGHES
ncbi:MAG: hypothetical protein U1E49_15875 [Hyphomicrobiaceae bacterium]